MAQEIVKSGADPSERPSLRERTHQREELFARNWVIDQNATRSYRAAGYKCKTEQVAGVCGAQVLKRPRVRKLIDKLLAARASRLEVKADRVLEEIQRLAFSDIRNYIRVQDGDAYVDLSRMTADDSAAIKEIIVEEYKDGRGEDARDVKRTTLRLHAKMPALEKLYQHAVPRVVDHIGRESGAPTVIIIDIPRPGGSAPIDVQVAAPAAVGNGNGSNGNKGNGNHA